MAPIKNLAIIGAGGNVGQQVLPMLLKNTDLNITVISRPTSSATFPSSVKILHASLDNPETFEEALQGQDAVLSLIGWSGIPQEGIIVDAAAKAGVKWFVPSEFGIDSTDPKVYETLPIFPLKAKVVEHLRAHEATMSWTALITGLFFDWDLAAGILGYDFKSHRAVIWDDGNYKFRMTNVTDVGQALVTLFTNEEARAKARNRFVKISSLQTSQNEVLAAAEKVTGAKWHVERLNGQEVVTEAKGRLAKGDVMATFDIVRSLAFFDGGWRDWSREAEEGNKILLPNGSETVEETVRRVAEGRIETPHPSLQ